MWTRSRGRPCAPPWWPANEPWPPARSTHAWRRRRARLFRGALFFVLPMFVMIALGASALFAGLARLLGVSSPAGSVGPIVAAALFFLFFVFGFRRLGSPVTDIVDAAQRVAGGDFTTRIDPRGPRFVRTVGSAFNTMTERLEAHDRQRRELMADIAHELRTPLTVIQGRLEGLLDGVYPRDDERLAGVLEETRVLARLVEDLRTLSNAETGILTLQREPTELGPLIQDVVHSLSGDSGAGVRVDASAELPVLNIDPVRVREVIENLLSNALRYTPGGGTVTISAHRRDDRVTVAVSDTGAGISAEDLPKIFDRFYKGRASRGSGLGLTIARNLVVAHGGTIRAESTPGRGTTITFDLPLY
jgi:two-component system OmpR family sensor kinase/two-component system sensor histidine kinase BaeS